MANAQLWARYGYCLRRRGYRCCTIEPKFGRLRDMNRRSLTYRPLLSLFGAGVGIALAGSGRSGGRDPCNALAGTRSGGPCGPERQRAVLGHGVGEPRHLGHPGPVAGTPPTDEHRPGAQRRAGGLGRRPRRRPGRWAAVRRHRRHHVRLQPPRVRRSTSRRPQASAPASESNEATLIPIDLAPLLDLPIINTSAAANWVSDTECVAAGTPLSQANQNLADLTLLEPVAGQSVVDLDTDAGDGAADSQVATFLAAIDGPGDARAVQARTTTDVSSANILNDLAGPGSAIQVDVVQAPAYVVQASGLPGGASVTGDRPVVNVQHRWRAADHARRQQPHRRRHDHRPRAR